MVKLSSELIENFSGSYLSPRYDDARPTPEFNRQALKLYCSDSPNCMVIAPRDHAKTTALSVDYILAESLFKSSDYIILVGSTEVKAQEILSNISEELHENELLIKDFKLKEFEVDAKTELIVVMSDGHRFRILARGAEQRIRGALWKGKRPNLIVCHKKGTPIFDYELGKWMNNQDHPTAKEIETECIKLSVDFVLFL